MVTSVIPSFKNTKSAKALPKGLFLKCQMVMGQVAFISKTNL